MNLFNDNALFEVFPAKENTAFSKLRGSDLQELLILLKNYLLELRKDLSLDSSVTFGLELEFERANALKVYNHFMHYSNKENWEMQDDMSIKKGGELISPVLKDTKDVWQSLKEICDFLSHYSKADKNTGGHIHLGAHILEGKDAWLNFLKLWSVYENIIFRFSYNDHLIARPSILSHAEPVAKDLWKCCLENSDKKLNDILDYLRSKRRGRAVNFRNVSKECYDTYEENNTIEFRVPNGTLNTVIWQNNVNLFAKMLLYANSSFFNQDIIDKRYLEVKDIFDSLLLYKEINLEQALEFCDLIFDNNLDKLNFLKQYLKDYKTAKSSYFYPQKCLLTRRK